MISILGFKQGRMRRTVAACTALSILFASNIGLSYGYDSSKVTSVNDETGDITGVTKVVDIAVNDTDTLRVALNSDSEYNTKSVETVELSDSQESHDEMVNVQEIADLIDAVKEDMFIEESAESSSQLDAEIFEKLDCIQAINDSISLMDDIEEASDASDKAAYDAAVKAAEEEAARKKAEEEAAAKKAAAAASSSSSSSYSGDELATYSSTWDGSVLTAAKGVNYGPSGKETYYNLNMSGVVSIMRSMGNTDEYWVRSDGCKMLGDYIMVAANLSVHPRGSLVETSLGTGIVCDTGGFANNNIYQLDIAVNW